MVYPLQEKLHISGMDDRAPSLARRWRLAMRCAGSSSRMVVSCRC